MSILTVHNLTKSYGENELFRSISCRIEATDRIGLIGPNGCGKTTLLRLLSGEETPDAGDIALSRGGTVGVMRQIAAAGTRTAYEETLGVFAELMVMEEELEALRRALEGNADPALIERQARLTEAFEHRGGLTFRSRARSALGGLGLMPGELELPLDALSGGQRSKVGLARLLLSGADLMLLDEPTNHLDIAATEWLEEFLRGYKGAAVIVSHDRYFLDQICTRTFSLENRTLYCEDVGYSGYIALKAERQKAEQRAYRNLSREIKRVEASVEKLKSFNREKSIRAAESKEKHIERMRQGLVKPDAEPREIGFTFTVKQPGGAVALSGAGLSMRFGPRTLYRDVGFEIRRGEHICLIGPNGCGKTTLLRQILARGDGVTFGHNLTIGYYDQAQEGLNPTLSVLDAVWEAHPGRTAFEVRGALAVFLFSGDEVHKKIGALSGGERARVMLTTLMLSGANMLLLDEPTNHLDLYAREALEGALIFYPGTLLCVSHDRRFINKLAHKVWLLTEDGLRQYDGNYDDYLRVHREAPPAAAPAREMGAGGRQYKARKAHESALRGARSALTRCEDAIAAVEEEQDKIRRELACEDVAADYERVLALTKRLDDLTRREEALLAEWESLHGTLEDLLAQDHL